MSKINIRSILENKTENKFFCNETVGILDENKIKYIDNKVTVVIEINDNDLMITRRSNDYEIILPLEFDKIKKGVYKVVGLGIIDLDVKTKKLNKEDNRIEIEYEMVMDKENISRFNFILEYGEEI